MPSLQKLVLLCAVVQRCVGLTAKHDAGAPSAVGQSFLVHDTCADHEGLGGHLRATRRIIDFAIKNGLTYVCNPNDFTPGQHSTGPLGDLFGCVNSSIVHAASGLMAAWDSVVESGSINEIEYDSVHKTMHKQPWRAPVPKTPFMYQEFKWDEPLPNYNDSNTIYALVGDCPEGHHEWTASQKAWFQRQYYLAKNGFRESEERCGFSDKLKNVVVHIRRGDAVTYENYYGLGYNIQSYIDVLKRVFAGDFHQDISIKESQSRIIVIAETPEDDPEMTLFKDAFKGAAKFEMRVGEGAQLITGWTSGDLAVRKRFIRDLDCMTSADVLIKSGGEFSRLASVLNKNGKVLSVNGNVNGSLQWGVAEPQWITDSSIANMSMGAAQACLPKSSAERDVGHEDEYRGWYDVQGCGRCLEYCRWVGHGSTGGDPALKQVSKDSYWSCRLAGSSTPYTKRGHFSTWRFAKCSGEDAVPPAAA